MQLLEPHTETYMIVLSVDVMDVAGEHQNDVAATIYKVRLDEKGAKIEADKAGI